MINNLSLSFDATSLNTTNFLNSSQGEIMGTEAHMSGQTKSQGKAEKRQTKRNRPRLHITLKKANLEWLRKVTPNISKFIDEIIDRLREETEPQMIFIGRIDGAGVAESGKGARLRV